MLPTSDNGSKGEQRYASRLCGIDAVCFSERVRRSAGAAKPAERFGATHSSRQRIALCRAELERMPLEAAHLRRGVN